MFRPKIMLNGPNTPRQITIRIKLSGVNSPGQPPPQENLYTVIILYIYTVKKLRQTFFTLTRWFSEVVFKSENWDETPRTKHLRHEPHPTQYTQRLIKNILVQFYLGPTYLDPTVKADSLTIPPGNALNPCPNCT